MANLNSKALLVIAIVVIGAMAYYWGTQTRTMRVDFSYDPQNNDYFANASLPVTIKNVSFHANFTAAAIPKMILRLNYNGTPIQIIQGDFRIDSTAVGELLATLNGLNGKSITIYLSFEPNISTISLPYLEIEYVPLNLG